MKIKKYWSILSFCFPDLVINSLFRSSSFLALIVLQLTEIIKML